MKQAKDERNTKERVGYVYRTLGGFARPHRTAFTRGMLASVGVVLCRLALPWPLRGILESTFPPNQRTGWLSALVPPWGNPIAWMAVGFVLVVLGLGLAEYVQRVAFSQFVIRTVHDARAAALSSFIKGGRETSTLGGAGNLISRVVTDSARVKSGLKGVLIHITQNGLLFLGVSVILLFADVQLGLTFLAGGAAAAALAVLGASRVMRAARQHRRKEGRLAEKVHRALTNGDVPAKFKRTNNTSSRADAEISKLEGLTTLGIHGVLGVTFGAVVMLGVQRQSAGHLQRGDLFTVLAYIVTVHKPMVRMGRQVARLGPVLASAERLAKMFRRRPKRQRDKGTAGPIKPVAGDQLDRDLDRANRDSLRAETNLPRRDDTDPGERFVEIPGSDIAVP